MKVHTARNNHPCASKSLFLIALMALPLLGNILISTYYSLYSLVILCVKRHNSKSTSLGELLTKRNVKKKDFLVPASPEGLPDEADGGKN